MAACPRCGVQNPDANRHCYTCGSALRAPAAPPPGYSAAAVSLQRTPSFLVLAVVGALVVLIGTAGVGIAAVAGRSVAEAQGLPQLGGPAPPRPASAEASPRPKSTPTPGQDVSIATLSVTVPAGFSLETKSANQVTVSTPDGDGFIQVQSDKLSKATSEEQLQQTAFSLLKQKYGDAKVCATETDIEVNGPSGSITKICFTVTEANTPAVSVAAIYWIATNAAHNVFYEVDGLTAADNFDGFMDETTPFVDSVSWKLN